MCEEFENEKKKEQDFFDLLERGFEPQIFSNLPAHDLNFLRKIKSKQASKRDRTLLDNNSMNNLNSSYIMHSYVSCQK